MGTQLLYPLTTGLLWLPADGVDTANLVSAAVFHLHCVCSSDSVLLAMCGFSYSHIREMPIASLLLLQDRVDIM